MYTFALPSTNAAFIRDSQFPERTMRGSIWNLDIPYRGKVWCLRCWIDLAWRLSGLRSERYARHCLVSFAVRPLLAKTKHHWNSRPSRYRNISSPPAKIVGYSFGGRHTNTSRTYHLNKDETCMSFLNTLVMVPMQCLAVSEQAEMRFVALYQPDTSSIISLSLD